MANAADERRALRCPVRIKRPLKLRVLFAARTPHERTITERTRLAARIVRSRTYGTKAGGLVGVGLLTPGVGEPGA